MLPETIEYGAMIEVPALVEVLDLLLPKVAFLSVGTNDLTQFLFAADRANPKLAARYDWLSPAILRFLKRVVDATTGHQVRLGLCGEMAGRRLEALGRRSPHSRPPPSSDKSRGGEPLKKPSRLQLSPALRRRAQTICDGAIINRWYTGLGASQKKMAILARSYR